MVIFAHRRFAALALAAVVGALTGVAAAPAAGGVYTVWSCKTADGAEGGTRHWKLKSRYDASGSRAGECPSGPLRIELAPKASHPADDYVRIRFTAPSNTHIRDYSIHRSAQVAPRYNFYVREYTGGGKVDVDECGSTSSNCRSVGTPSEPLSAANEVRSANRSDLKAIQLAVKCAEEDSSGTACAPASPAAGLQLHRARITLFDGFAPRFEARPVGPLVDSSRPLTGVQQVWIAASDKGSGVYTALAEVDGQVVAGGVLDPNGGRCQEPFLWSRPCKTTTSGSLALNTAQLPDGPHRLRLLVTDATGTNVAEWGPVRIETANDACNPAPPTDALGMRAAFVTPPARRGGRPRLRRSVLTRYGRSPLIRGRLATPDGRPVVGATVCIVSRTETAEGTLQKLGTTVTDANGEFRHRVRGGPSREIYAVHRSPAGAVTARMLLRARTRVALRRSRRSLRNGERLTLSGRLVGRPVPRRGVVVEVQARRGRRWQTFGTARARSSGRFRFRYRFTRTRGVQRYLLRARVPRQAAYPYATSASRRVTVRVRGR